MRLIIKYLIVLIFLMASTANAIDALYEDIKVIVEGNVDTSVPGRYVLKYKAKDGMGNESTAKKVVYVKDSLGNREGSTVFISSSPTIENVYDDDKASQVIRITTEGTSTGYQLGQSINRGGSGQTIIRNFEANSRKFEPKNSIAEANGMFVRASMLLDDITPRIVTKDTIPPIINLNTNETIFLNLNDIYTETVTAIDAVYGKVEVFVDGNVDTSVAGRYVLKYKAKDGSANASTAKRVVYVRDRSGNTILEDASDGNTKRWTVLTSGAPIIANVYGNDNPSKLHRIATEGISTGDSTNRDGSWKNTTDKIISWNIKTKNNFSIHIKANTTEGIRTFIYSPDDSDAGINKHSVRLGIGSHINDGTWQTIVRDLEADLKKFESDNSIIEINGMFVKGSMSLDDITLGTVIEDTTAPVINLNTNETIFLNLNDTYTETVTAIDAVYGKVEVIVEGSVNTSVAGRYLLKYKATDGSGNASTARRIVYVRDSSGSVIYENGEDGTTQAWVVADTNPTGATIENTYDKSRDSRVIKFIGDGVKNGYRLGDSTNIFKAWNNKEYKEIQWSMKYSESVRIYIGVTTNHGKKTLLYNTEDGQKKRTVQDYYLYHGLGYYASNDKWQTFSRDLEKDLKFIDSSFKLLEVNNFYVRGSGLIDDIKMGDNLMPPVITFDGGEIRCIARNTEFNDLATAVDANDGEVTLEVEGTVDTATNGTYILKYRAVDYVGNPAYKEKRVYVLDNIKDMGNKCSYVKTYLEKVYIPDVGNDGDTSNDIFRLFYSLEDPKHKIDFIDENSNNIPDKVENFYIQLSTTKDMLENELGLTAPLKSERYVERYNNKVKYIDILINDIPYNGTAGDDPTSKYIYSALQNDGNRSSIINLDYRLSTTNLTPSHELFHLYQYSSTMFKNRWYLEGLAAWEGGLLGLGTPKKDEFLPKSSEELQSILDNSYGASRFFAKLFSLISEKTNFNNIPYKDITYVDSNTPVVIDSTLTGYDVIAILLDNLRFYDKKLSLALGYNTNFWTENEQRYAKNNNYILLAIKKTIIDLKSSYQSNQELADFVNAIDSYLIENDLVGPYINLHEKSNLYIDYGSTFVDEEVTAIDDVYGEVNITVEGSVDTSVAGRYILEYKAIDGSGNESTARRAVYVRDSSGNTVLEDASDGNTEGWAIFDANPSIPTIENVYDNDKDSRVIRITTEGRSTGYRLGHSTNREGSWKNTTDKIMSWDIKTSNDFIIYITLNTTEGAKALEYRPSDSDLGMSGNYVRLGIGSEINDGDWRSITRNLEEDLHKFLPNANITEVNGMFIRGTMLLDDIKLRSDTSTFDIHFTVITEKSDVTINDVKDTTDLSCKEFIELGDSTDTYTTDYWAEKFNACEEDHKVRDKKAINFYSYDNYGDGTSCGKRNSKIPFVLIDFARLNHTTQSPEEHEMGHAFGLGHTCIPSATSTNIMASSSNCTGSGGKRDIGFSNEYIGSGTLGQIDTILYYAPKIKDKLK